MPTAKRRIVEGREWDSEASGQGRKGRRLGFLLPGVSLCGTLSFMG